MNFFLLIENKEGPNTSLPFGVNLFFNKMVELYFSLKLEPSFLLIDLELYIMIPLDLEPLITQLFGLVFFTLTFIKPPDFNFFT
jgi:hypothetical protein